MAKAKILGKLKGIIASAKESSRNDRKYTESFWDAKFNSDIFQEGLANKVYFGQLFHPDNDEEYSQIHCDDRSAIVLTDVKKKGLDYEGTFDILPTKAGQCLRNLLDIGCIFGVSSRGLSDYNTDVFDESMAPYYDLITWDVVAFPGLKCCRLHEVSPVAEGFQHKNKVKIMESLQQMSSEDKDIKDYVNNALKLKEDFDSLQVEDLAAKYHIPTDFIEDFSHLILRTDAEGFAYFDDGIHGKHGVEVPWNFLAEPDSLYLVSDIYFSTAKDMYVTDGDWIKLK